MQVIRPPRTQMHRAASRTRRVLAICGDTQVGLWLLRSLARRGLTVFAVCSTPTGQAAHSRYCCGSWFMDHGPDAAPPEEQIQSLARQLEVGSIMPIAESHHAALIKCRDRLEPDVHLFSPSAEAFAKAGQAHRADRTSYPPNSRNRSPRDSTAFERPAYHRHDPLAGRAVRQPHARLPGGGCDSC